MSMFTGVDIDRLSPRELAELQKMLTPRLNKYMPHIPTAKQSAFLLLDCLEAFYGGAAGGGKSDALLMAALQYVDVPGYSAILFRRTYADLTLPGALMDRAKSWLEPHKDVKWSEKDKVYRFPSGATLSFGYLENDGDKYRYQSAEFQFIGFDELTQLYESVYTYMFSRLRRLKNSTVPLRVRSASNPGNAGHEWVKQRFLTEGPGRGRIFIPASLRDNPYLDSESYSTSLNELDAITRAQLMEGNWDVKRQGAMFDRGWFEIVEMPPIGARRVRYWDLASTEVKKNKDPDWTVGLLLSEQRGIYYVEHVVRARKTPADVETLVKNTASMDGYTTSIWMEQEPGSSGVNTIDHYARDVLKGFTFRGYRESGSKALRAAPVSSAAEQGRIKLVRGPWISDFLDELEVFPAGRHDDQVDAFSGAFHKLHKLNYDALPIDVQSDGGSYWNSYGGYDD